MEFLANTTAATKYATAQGTAAATVTLTVAADTAQVHTLDWMIVSFDDPPSADSVVTVAIGGNNLVVFDTRDQTAQFLFDPPVQRTVKNEALVITATSGGTGIKGRISIGYR